MENKLSRIAMFIESLPAEDSIGENQSALLTTNIDAIGGGTTNGGNCVNEIAEDCYKSKNGGDCKNYARCNKTTNNGSCGNLKPENPSCPSIINPNPTNPIVPLT